MDDRDFVDTILMNAAPIFENGTTQIKSSREQRDNEIIIFAMYGLFCQNNIFIANILSRVIIVGNFALFEISGSKMF